MPPFYYSLGTFGIMEFLGDVWPGLIANSRCYPVLGCNAGFFGYDALVHLISGICIGLGLLWYKRRQLRDFAVWTLGIAVGWECVEWSYDHFRMWVLHMDLLHPLNIMAQPTGLDTLGDITMGCTGALLVYACYRLRPKKHE